MVSQEGISILLDGDGGHGFEVARIGKKKGLGRAVDTELMVNGQDLEIMHGVVWHLSAQS